MRLLNNKILIRPLSFLGIALFLIAAEKPSTGSSAGSTDLVSVLSLKQTLEKGMENSHAIIQAVQDTEASDAGYSSALSALYPTLNFEGSAGTFHDKTPAAGEMVQPLTARDRNAYDAKLVLTQNLYSGFADLSTIRSKSADRQAKIHAEDQIKNDVRRQIIELYFGIQLDLKKIEAQSEISSLRKRQLDEVLNKQRQGRATEVEYLQAEYAVKSQDPQIKRLEADRELKSLRLGRLIGFDLSGKFRLSDSLDDANKLIAAKDLPKFSDAFDVALKRNPELAKVEAEFNKTAAELQASYAKHHPSLDLVLQAGSQASRRDEISSSDRASYGGMLRLTVPLFSGLSSFSDSRSNKARLLYLQEARALQREKVLEDLQQSYRSLELAQQLIEAEEANLKLSEKSIRNSETLYRVGRATLTDVLDGYTKKLTAKESLMEAMYNRIIEVARIKNLLGQ